MLYIPLENKCKKNLVFNSQLDRPTTKPIKWYFFFDVKKQRKNAKGIWFAGLFYKFDFSSVRHDIKSTFRIFFFITLVLHRHHDYMRRLPVDWDWFCLSPQCQDQQLEACCRHNVIILHWQLLFNYSFAFLLSASNQHTHSQTQFTRVWMEKDKMIKMH